MSESVIPPAHDERESPALLTFLIADVRGYTGFTQERGDEWAARLADRFAGIAEQIVRKDEGHVLELRGDEALAVFSSARRALHAAVALQDAFGIASKEDPTLPLNVGIGLDAGEPIPLRGGYRGKALNLAARLCSIASPGSVLASDTVIHLVGMMDDLTFHDRGLTSLKGLLQPVRVVQVTHHGVMPDASLTTVSPVMTQHHNLPNDPTQFVGRVRQMNQLLDLLNDPSNRLVTLTGPGGTGKTRLALHIGQALLDSDVEGVYVVFLGAVEQADLVPSMVREALGIPSEPGRSPLESIAAWVAEKRILLIMDNFEHMLDAVYTVVHLLERCPALSVLATSRIPLHVSWEQEYPVPPMDVPDTGYDGEAVLDSESVTLFTARARAVKPEFELTPEVGAVVAEICRRLDGLPLAIELAAVRVKVFPPRSLLNRLSESLKVLTGGATDRPSRQQTLRGAIDWSYSLLSPAEQVLFERLSVFAGSCTFEAVEAVCDVDGTIDVIAVLTSLTDKSLVQVHGEDEARFSMLNTIREYATEKLVSRGETEVMREAHARYLRSMSEEIKPALTGRDQASCFARLDADMPDLRAAIGFLFGRGHTGEALRIVTDLFDYWVARTHAGEARKWIEAGLATGGRDLPDETRAWSLWFVGTLDLEDGDHGAAMGPLNEALTIFRHRGDDLGIARSLLRLGLAFARAGTYDRATASFEEAIPLCRRLQFFRGLAAGQASVADVAQRQGNIQLAIQRYAEAIVTARDAGDNWVVAQTLSGQGQALLASGDETTAQERFEESLSISRSLLDTRLIASNLYELGVLATVQDDFTSASSHLAECLKHAQELRDPVRTAGAYTALGIVSTERGDFSSARAYLSEAFALQRSLPTGARTLELMDRCAALELAVGEAESAGCLLGAVAGVMDSASGRWHPLIWRQHQQLESRVREMLGDPAWEQVTHKGRSLPPEAIISRVLQQR